MGGSGRCSGGCAEKGAGRLEAKDIKRHGSLSPWAPPVSTKSLFGKGTTLQLRVTLCVCPTLCDLMDCSPPGSSVYGILQARILEWVAMASSRGSFRPRDQTCVSCVSCIGRWILYHCVTWASQFLFIIIGKNRQWYSLAEVHPALFGGRNVMHGPWVFTEFSQH